MGSPQEMTAHTAVVRPLKALTCRAHKSVFISHVFRESCWQILPKSKFSSPSGILKAFPWDCFPGLESQWWAAATLQHCQELVAISSWFFAHLSYKVVSACLGLQDAEGSPAGVLVRGSIKGRAPISCESRGAGNSPGGLQGLCQSRPPLRPS